MNGGDFSPSGRTSSKAFYGETLGGRVEHVDFISVPVSDMDRSVAWYRDTLGLPQTGEGGFPEFKLGDNVFLYLIDPKSVGAGEFRTPHGSPIALRVADVAETRKELEARGIEFVDDDPRHQRLPHGSVRRPGRKPLHAPPEVCAA